MKPKWSTRPGTRLSEPGRGIAGACVLLLSGTALAQTVPPQIDPEECQGECTTNPAHLANHLACIARAVRSVSGAHGETLTRLGQGAGLGVLADQIQAASVGFLGQNRDDEPTPKVAKALKRAGRFTCEVLLPAAADVAHRAEALGPACSSSARHCQDAQSAYNSADGLLGDCTELLSTLSDEDLWLDDHFWGGNDPAAYPLHGPTDCAAQLSRRELQREKSLADLLANVCDGQCKPGDIDRLYRNREALQKFESFFLLVPAPKSKGAHPPLNQEQVDALRYWLNDLVNRTQAGETLYFYLFGMTNDAAQTNFTIEDALALDRAVVVKNEIDRTMDMLKPNGRDTFYKTVSRPLPEHKAYWTRENGKKYDVRPLILSAGATMAPSGEERAGFNAARVDVVLDDYLSVKRRTAAERLALKRQVKDCLNGWAKGSPEFQVECMNRQLKPIYDAGVLLFALRVPSDTNPHAEADAAVAQTPVSPAPRASPGTSAPAPAYVTADTVTPVAPVIAVAPPPPRVSAAPQEATISSAPRRWTPSSSWTSASLGADVSPPQGATAPGQPSDEVSAPGTPYDAGQSTAQTARPLKASTSRQAGEWHSAPATPDSP